MKTISIQIPLNEPQLITDKIFSKKNLSPLLKKFQEEKEIRIRQSNQILSCINTFKSMHCECWSDSDLSHEQKYFNIGVAGGLKNIQNHCVMGLKDNSHENDNGKKGLILAIAFDNFEFSNKECIDYAYCLLMLLGDISDQHLIANYTTYNFKFVLFHKNKKLKIKVVKID